MPSTVASAVVATAVMTLFSSAARQRSLPKKSSYQRSEYSCTGNVKNGSFEKDSGTTTKNGATKKARTATTKPSSTRRPSRSPNVA